jgi:hypothetical protein
MSENFVEAMLDLFKIFKSYHSPLVHPETNDERKKRTLMTKVLACSEIRWFNSVKNWSLLLFMTCNVALKTPPPVSDFMPAG